MGLRPIVVLGSMHPANADNISSALITLPDAMLAKATPEPKRVLSEMVDETLAMARRQPLFKIGEYEWCEPDYRQILLWAEALTLEPEEVIRRLLDERSLWLNRWCLPRKTAWSKTVFSNGRMVSLNWDGELLPRTRFDWVEGMEIEYLRVLPIRQVSGPAQFHALDLSLPILRELHCDVLRIHELELSRVPMLTKLSCNLNRLTRLDLSNAPMLRKLSCESSSALYKCLDKLDLSGVPSLEELFCERNGLTKLDLSKVPMLKKLSCGMNELSQLDLSGVPQLEELSCWGARLSELDLTRVPMLTSVQCGLNEISKLDLSGVPKLLRLSCRFNQLAELNLSAVPELTELDCDGNQLTKLELREVPKLMGLSCYRNQLTELDISCLQKREWLYCDGIPTRLIQHPDQNIEITPSDD